MISYLEGKVLKINDNSIVLLTNAGIGFEVSVPGSVFSEISYIGQELFLYTYMSVSENGIGLYGFLDENELEFFKLLISVSGIGPKGAVSILSAMSIEELTFAISADDAKTIAKAPGVGKKTAEKMIVELRDKVSKIGTGNISELAFGEKIDGTKAADSNTAIKSEAVEALKVLGISATEAMKRVSSVNIEAEDTVEDIINKALLAG